jgi:hypothetical protein
VEVELQKRWNVSKADNSGVSWGWVGGLGRVGADAGLTAITERYPKMKVITAEVDSHLNEKKSVSS